MDSDTLAFAHQARDSDNSQCCPHACEAMIHEKQ